MDPRDRIPAIVLLFRAVHRHYGHVRRQLRIPHGWKQSERVHIVVLLVGGVHRGTLEALVYARALQPDRWWPCMSRPTRTPPTRCADGGGRRAPAST